MSRTATLLRFFACGLVAVVVFVGGGGWLVHHFLGNPSDNAVGVQLVQGIKRITSLSGNDATKQNPAAEAPQKPVSGFVQVAFTVGKDGRAHAIHVVSAKPAGVYDKAAIAVIAARHFDPAPTDEGTKERSEIVHFRVAADQPKPSAKAKAKTGGGS